MTSWSITFIAFGLALDAFAVSITSGITIHKLRLRHALLIALFFGGFQALMPIIGWQCGLITRTFAAQYDHWIAFILLCAIGGKMIWEAIKIDENKKDFNPLKLTVLFLLAIATSIDAFAVGITLSCLQINIIIPAAIIGSITFIISLAGTYIGSFFGHIFENKLEIIGGIILIVIGTKILIQHTCM